MVSEIISFLYIKDIYAVETSHYRTHLFCSGYYIPTVAQYACRPSKSVLSRKLMSLLASGMGRSEVETCLVNLYILYIYIYIYIYIYSKFNNNDVDSEISKKFNKLFLT